MAYCTQQDIENALSEKTVLAIYDDDQDGSVDMSPMQACIKDASAKVDAFLANNYIGTLPLSPVPDIIVSAAVDFACAYTARRRPDLIRAMGEKPWDEFRKCAQDNMMLFVKSLQRLPASVPEATPANVGGKLVSDDPQADTPPTRVFTEMGDF